MRDCEAFLESSQQNVTGRVFIQLKPYHFVMKLKGTTLINL